MKDLRLVVDEGKVFRQVAYKGDFEELKRKCTELKRLGSEGKARLNEAGPETGRTALHWGAIGGHTKVVSYLLKAAHVDVDPLDFELNTPLNFVIQAPELSLQKKLSIIDILLAAEANPKRPNIHGKTPLMNLEALRDSIPDSHYFQRKYVDSTIRRIKESIDKGVSASVVSNIYASKQAPTFKLAPTGLRYRP